MSPTGEKPVLVTGVRAAVMALVDRTSQQTPVSFYCSLKGVVVVVVVVVVVIVVVFVVVVVVF